MFFEYNLPKFMPSYIDDANRDTFNSVLNHVAARMDKLEQALKLSGLTGEVFSVAVEKIFDPGAETHIIDSMTEEEIANVSKLMSVGVVAEPRLEWPNAEVVVDTAFVGRKEWEMLRMLGMGGSDAAVVMGISPYNSRAMLYHTKCGTKFPKEEKPDPGKEYIFEYGHRMEDMVIDQFCKRNGCTRIRETRMFRKKDYPYITANIDAIVRFPTGELAVFESKTTVLFNREKWANHSCPPYYVPQCNQYMCVLNDPRIQRAFIGCIYGNTPEDFQSGIIQRDAEYEEDLINAEMSFWNDYLLAGIEPDMNDNAKANKELVDKKIDYADRRTKTVAVPLPENLLSSVKGYLEVREKRRQLEAQVAALKENEDVFSLPLREALGSNIKGVVETNNEKYTITYNPVSRTTIDTEKLLMVYPEAYAACSSTPRESYRTFSIKELKKK